MLHIGHQNPEHALKEHKKLEKLHNHALKHTKESWEKLQP